MRLAKVAVLIGVLALFASSAAAQRTSSLSWVRLEGAEACIGAQELARRVEERVGRRVFVSASQADLSLEGHVAREGNSLVARFAVSDRHGVVLGRRVLRVAGTDCTAIEASLVLVIAIGLDPETTLPLDAQPGEPLSDETKTMLAQLELPKLNDEDLRALAVPDPAARHSVAAAESGGSRLEPKPVVPPQLDDASPGSRRIALAVHLGASVELGVLPEASVGGGLRVTLHVSPLWPIQLSLAGVVPQTMTLSTTHGAGEFQFWAVGVAVCPSWFESQPLGVRTCAGGRGGVLRSEGSGFAQPLTAASPWADVTLQAGPALRLGSFGVDLAVRLSVPFVRDTYRYEDLGGRERSLHRPGSVVGGVELAGGYFF
jgi:hypothetical protein